MTREEFEIWKRKWYNTVPRCTDFVCCHEMTSCGIERQCGDCTIYPTWKFFREGGREHFTCTDVGCIDCLRNHDCNRRRYDR